MRSNGEWHNFSGIQKIKGRRTAGAIALSKRKGSFIEDDMSRDDHSIRGHVKAAVSFVMRGIAEKHVESRPGRKLVRSSGRQVGITLAAENLEMIIRWSFAEEGKVRRGVSKGFGRQDVPQHCCRGKSFGLVGGRHGCLE